MAVEIEFVNVIIRKSALGVKYPGGLDAFATTDLPNYIEDDHLVRIGFMSTAEACELAEALMQHGLSFDNTEQSDIAIVQQNCPAWLTFGKFGDSVGCWLTGRDCGPLLRCTNGFLLRCPRDLFDRLETVMKTIGIVATRSEPQHEDEQDFIQVVNFSRQNAFVTANVIGEKDSSGPVGLWASRDLSRREHCAEDIQFALDIETILLKHGAESG